MNVTIRYRLALVAMFCLFSTSCYKDEFASLHLALQRHETAIRQLREEFTDGLTLALCSSELRQLLENVQMECAQTDPATPAQCSTKQIKPAIVAADPERKDRFLKLMSHLPHEVVYIADGASGIVPMRAERLERLARRSMLRNTVFLVVSSPELGEAEAQRRALFIDGMLRNWKVPPDKIRRWYYAFPTNKTDIEKKVDLPGLVETKELSRGVWVFRADC